MKNIKIPFTFLLVILFSSCASVYVPPESGSTSILELPVSNSSWRLSGVSGLSAAFAIEDSDGCGTIARKMSPLNQGDKVIEVIIPANKTIFINTGFYVGNNYCISNRHFVSKENKTYKIKPLLQDKTCSVAVFESDGSSQISIPLEKATLKSFPKPTMCKK